MEGGVRLIAALEVGSYKLGIKQYFHVPSFSWVGCGGLQAVRGVRTIQDVKELSLPTERFLWEAKRAGGPIRILKCEVKFKRILAGKYSAELEGFVGLDLSGAEG